LVSEARNQYEAGSKQSNSLAEIPGLLENPEGIVT
jgi:hypothetical protein